MTEAFVNTYAGLYLVVLHRFEGSFAEGVVPLCKIWEGAHGGLSYGVDRWRVWPTFSMALGDLVGGLLTHHDRDNEMICEVLQEAQGFAQRCGQYRGSFNPGKSWFDLVDENRLYPAHGIDAYAAGIYDNMVARSIVRKRLCPPWTQFVPNLKATKRLELLQSLLQQADTEAVLAGIKKSEVLR